MSVETTRANLLALEEAHRDDHDGGYLLASALCAYREEMLEGTADFWDEILVGWVRDEPPRFWGVALEALARAGGTGVNQELARMLRDSDRGAEWREYVANTLIRRGFADDALKREVEQSARQMSPMGLPNLAALLILVPELLAAAVTCIVSAIRSGEYDYVRANVPPFVYAAADSDPELLLRFVRQTHDQNQEAGKMLASMVIDYLGKPFIQKQIGTDVAAYLTGNLRRLL